MNEGYVSTGRVVASLLWGWVVMLLAVAWVIALFAQEHWRIAGLLAATACASSALAAVMQIRTYMVKICTLVRVRIPESRTGEEPVGERPHLLR